MYIRLNFQIFIIFLMFLLTRNTHIYFVTLIFIVVHELAHIIMSMCLGFKITKVNTCLLGFSVLLKKPISNKEKLEKLIIAVSGPLVNILIAVVFVFLSIDSSIKEMIVYSNILIAVINLLPIYPLDGGRIIKEILEISYSKLSAIKIVEKITYVSIIIITILSSILILFYKNIAIFIGIAFLWFLVISEYRKNKYRKIAYEIIENSTFIR